MKMLGDARTLNVVFSAVKRGGNVFSERWMHFRKVPL